MEVTDFVPNRNCIRMSMITFGHSRPNIPEYPQIADQIRQAIDEVGGTYFVWFCGAIKDKIKSYKSRLSSQSLTQFPVTRELELPHSKAFVPQRWA